MSRSEKSWKRLPEYPAVEKTTAGTLWFLVQAGYITQKHTMLPPPPLPILSEIFLYIYKPRNKPDNFGGRETVII
nr:hypothetical protein Iba_chr12cCG8730 [Ipomoea batatas]GMD72352.1 hypothetical protein Iba_chr12fCG7790 [Ipomoea batatas]